MQPATTDVSTQASAAPPEEWTADPGSGALSIRACFREAWHAALRNLRPFLGLLGLLAVIELAADLLIFVASVVHPILMQVVSALAIGLALPTAFWGVMAFSLRAIDGSARAVDVLDVFCRGGWRLGRAILLSIACVLIQLPVVLTTQHLPESAGVALRAVVLVALLLWSFGVFARFWLSIFFLVEQPRKVRFTLRSSWQATRKHPFRWAALAALSNLILPVMLVPWMGFLLATRGLGGLFVVLGFVVSFCPVGLLYASAYRQTVGRPVAT